MVNAGWMITFFGISQAYIGHRMLQTYYIVKRSYMTIATSYTLRNGSTDFFAEVPFTCDTSTGTVCES